MFTIRGISFCRHCFYLEVVEYSVLYMYNIGGNKLGDKGVYQIVQHLKFIPHLENLYLCTINYWIRTFNSNI